MESPGLPDGMQHCPLQGHCWDMGCSTRGTHFPDNRSLHVPVLLDLKSNSENLSEIYNNFLLSLVEQRKHKVYLFPF